MSNKLYGMATHPSQHDRSNRAHARAIATFVVVVTVTLIFVIVAGCKRGDDTISPDPGTAIQTTAPVTTALPGADAAVTAWATVWAVAALTPGSEDAARAVATPEVVDRVKALTAGAARTATTSPRLTRRSAGGIAIEDCVILAPRLGEEASTAFTGAVEDGRVTELQPRDGRLAPCVPASMAGAVIAGYRDYWTKRPQYSDPADPTNALIAETTTGNRRTNLVQQLTGDQQRNQALRGTPQTHPEVIEVRSPAEVVISDCQLQDPAWGVYDRATGALVEGRAVTPDRRDLYSAVMRLEDGRWKVEDLQGREGASCEFAPTSLGLPSL